MSNQNQFIATAYSPYEPNLPVFGLPIIAKQIPTTANKAPLGSIWVVPSTNAVYILSSIVNNLANWILLGTSGGPGSFTTLASTGATTLATTGASVNTFGNLTAGTTLTLSTPTGTPVVSSNGLTATAGNITASAGNFVLSTAATMLVLPGPVNIMTGAGAPAAGLAVNVGDMYINTTAASAVTRAYMASAANTWVNFTMSA
jgi:hypothetical protein